jgi:hypothetical protein
VVYLFSDSGAHVTSESSAVIEVDLGVNPSSFAVLYPVGNSFQFVEGVARCEGLYINDVDVGYTLLFVTYDLGLSVQSAFFDNVLGAPYKIALTIHPGTATGGSPFNPQPVVAVVDKGGNTVITQNLGAITTSISNNPNEGVMTPVSQVSATISRGIASFSGLKIDKFGNPYVLRFVTDLDLEGDTEVECYPFTVGVGAAYEMNFLSLPNGATGGTAFAQQPMLEVLDAGGNLLFENSVSQVRAYISSNPSGGVLSPDTALTVQLVRGVATFTNLEIDLFGNDYRLSFAFANKLTGVERWVATGLVMESSIFNVVIGSVSQLKLIRGAGNAWAGGQPFLDQPMLVLEDGGANAADDSTSQISAFMVTSLAAAGSVVVDSSAAAVVTVTAVTLSPDTGTYTVGQVITVSVTFSDEVTAYIGSDDTDYPYLTMGLPDAASAQDALCVDMSSRLTTLRFEFTVVEGDASSALDYTTTASLFLQGDSSIVDGLGRAVDLTLPAPGGTAVGSLPVSSSVVIDTTAPYPIAMTCATPGDGTYTAGQILQLSVQFSFPVVVDGRPPLILMETGTEAVYASGSGTDTLLFTYSVLLGESATDFEVDSGANKITLVTDDRSDPSLDPDPDLLSTQIRAFSTAPTLDAVLTFDQAGFTSLSANQDIALDMGVPAVDTATGVYTASADGTYTTGDSITITLMMTEDVVIDGLPYLEMSTGTAKTPAFFLDPDDDGDQDPATNAATKQINFLYSVRNTDVASDLTYEGDTAFDLNGATIMRYVSEGTPEIAAELSLTATTAAAKALGDNSDIVIEGAAAVVIDVGINSGYTSGTYTVGNVVQLEVTFDKEVTVVYVAEEYDVDDADYFLPQTFEPYLRLETGDRSADAYLVSGSGTTTLVFNYTVLLADEAADLEVLDKNSLKLPDGVYLYNTAAEGTQNADLELPDMTLGGILVDGATTGSTVAITKVSTTTASGTYGVGEVIYVYVEFSAAVFYFGNPPTLLMNTGQEIPWFEGTGSSLITFVYVVRESDTTSALDFSSVVLPNGSEIYDYNTQVVDYDMSALDWAAPAPEIIIDTTAPVVVDVRIEMDTSTINNGTYVVGDEIVVIVQFNFPVYIIHYPQIVLETGDTDRIVDFSGFADGDTSIMYFAYEVQEGDRTDDLTYKDTASLGLNYDQAEIMRYSGQPTTDAVLTLPIPGSLGNTPLVIRTDHLPYVLGVEAQSSSTPNGLYRAGDTVLIEVSMSRHVSVSGTPILYLELGATDNYATYLSGSGSTVLVFSYVVSEGDFVLDLDYKDPNSLVLPDDSSIRHLSTNPTVDINLQLPFVGTTGSLSHSNNLRLEGRAPILTNLYFAAHAGGGVPGAVMPTGTLTKGEEIAIVLEMSSNVTVAAGGDNADQWPRLLMEAGDVDRYATYQGGTNSRRLTFVYTVEVGDANAALDYAELFDDATGYIAAFDLNGATILLESSNPTVPAVVHLNPVKGHLEGTLQITSEAGIAQFRDLKIVQRGVGYQIFFSTPTQGPLYSSTSFNVVFSSEFEVMSTDNEARDNLGYSVDISGGRAIAGAPRAEQARREVQIIRTVGSSDVLLQQVQYIRTFATPRTEVQVLETSVLPGYKVGGSFLLTWGTHGPTRPIPYNAHAAVIKIALEADIPLVGRVTVTREANDECACRGAYVWTVTFENARGEVYPLVADIAKLRGNHVALRTETLQHSTVIGGAFTLSAYGKGVTTDVAHDIGALELRRRLTLDLGLAVDAISISAKNQVTFYGALFATRPSSLQILSFFLSTPSPQPYHDYHHHHTDQPHRHRHYHYHHQEGGYEWRVTFLPTYEEYDPPRLMVETSKMTGYGAGANAWIERHGRAPLSGSFRVAFAGHTSEMIAFDESAEDLKATLEALSPIEEVTVERFGPLAARGYVSCLPSFIPLFLPVFLPVLPSLLPSLISFLPSFLYLPSLHPLFLS